MEFDMCGIAGIVNFNEEHWDRNLVHSMIHTMRHRGPDGEGVFADQHVALGHVRLSIIDIEGSAQPLANEDESIWVTFNGEIYNYADLRKDLISRGHKFKTCGDTEVLVHLYEECGHDMVQYLQGMFAFAIWDKKKKKLLMVRDRMGIKPLYYCQNGNDLLFASEPKAFFCHPGIKACPDTEGIWHYLTYRSVPAPKTLFQGVYKLRPGHMMVVTQHNIEEISYWDIPLKSKCSKMPKKQYDIEQEISEVEKLLFKSIKQRLISDVPLGAFLSGGVDSSLIVAIMSKLTNLPVKTYSVGFNDFPDSELQYAGIVAKQYKTDHHELLLEEDCFADHMEKLTWIRDAPLSEPADIPLHLLAKMARQDVKVLLSGEGSDEIYAGYPKYAFDRFAPAVSLLPNTLTQLAGQLLSPRFRRVEVAIRSLRKKNNAERWSQWFAPFTQQEKQSLATNSDSWENPHKQYTKHLSGCSRLDGMLYTDCKLWLPDNLLDRSDRMTMGASVEGRVPFLDHKLVEHAFALPDSMKIRAFDRKWIIKQVALRHLPESIITRRKIGFSVPLSQWFKGKLRDLCYDRICQSDGLMTQLFSHQVLRKTLDDHCADRKDNALKIWTLLGLSIWDDVFCNNKALKSSL